MIPGEPSKASTTHETYAACALTSSSPPFDLLALPDGCLLEVMHSDGRWSLRSVCQRFRDAVEGGRRGLRLRHVPPSAPHLRRLLRRLPLLTELDFNDATYTKRHPLDPPSGPDLSALSPCAGLTSLKCSSIGVADVSPLAACPLLRTLRLSHVRDISGLASCTLLVDLDLSECPDLQDLAAVASMPCLVSLRVQLGAAVRHLDALAPCTLLDSLHVSGGTGLSSISGLATCTRLTTLRLDVCAPLTRIDALWGCGASLVWLDLSLCKCVVDLGPVAACTRLLTCLLACDSVAGGGIGALAACVCLETLRLSGCPKGLDLAPLMACSELQCAGLGGYTWEHVAELKAAWPRLSIRWEGQH